MTAPRLRILLVEDNPDDADILRETVADTRARVHVHVVERLAEAIDLLERQKFDLVLLDLSLPDSQGLATVERTLAHPSAPPIVVLTGLEDESLGAAAVHAGAQDYLVKGQVDGQGLVRCMHYAVERHQLLAAQTEDAEVWSALARCGEALLGAAGRGLLERLCNVAAAELGCNAAHLWALDEEGGAYVAVAAKPADELSRLANVRLARNVLAPLADAGEEEDGVRWLTPELRRSLPAELLPSRTSDAALLLGLEHGGELLGILVCTFAEPPPAADATNRVARGLLHLGALALSNARLVDDLERSNTIKTYFAATMSHELRNTLFAIAGLSDILRDGLNKDERTEMERLASAIGARSRESQAMIQAALELTRSELRPLDCDSGEVAVGELLQQLASEAHVPAGKSGLRIDCQIPKRLPPLRTDALKLSMVLRNLISNAIKFTDRGYVRVAAEATNGTVRFVVADSGIGIDAADVPHLFEPFRQVHGQRSKRAGGAGLGLYIVGRLVELLGGSITVDSRSGGGTTFTVSLPVSPRRS